MKRNSFRRARSGPSAISHQPSARPSARHGFTLIELLTVIAIIAILAALLLPVLATAGAQMRKARCQENIKALVQGVKMYYDDYGVYPDALYGVSVNGGPLEKRLAGFKVRDEAQFTCPNADPSLRANNSLVAPTNRTTNAAAVNYPRGQALKFPARSTYDLQFLGPTTAAGKPELHYAQKWTPASSGGAADDPRQLYRKDPPADTVVTWCLYHADFDQTGNVKGGTAIVGFLGGQIKVMDAKRLINWTTPGSYPWQVKP